MIGANKGFNPRDAVSPKADWQLIDVLHEGEHWSMAVGRWDKRPALAQRWNGKEGAKGNPVSHGFPTWFVMPDDTYGLFLESEFIPELKRAFVKDILGL